MLYTYIDVLLVCVCVLSFTSLVEAFVHVHEYSVCRKVSVSAILK